MNRLTIEFVKKVPGLIFEVGDQIDLNVELAERLISLGYAIAA